jgi:tyrosyl-tRNA synthetase
MEELVVEGQPLLADFLTAHGLAKSKSEARRLMEQNGVRVAGQAVTDINARLEFTGEVVVQVGKRRFVKARR